MSINVLNTPESVVSLVTPKLKITGNSGTPKLDLLTNFFEGLTTEEQSGDLVSFENTAGLPMPFLSLKTSIEAVQDLHGYSNPWVGGAGANKLPTKFYTGIPYNGAVGATVTLTETTGVTKNGETYSKNVTEWSGIGMISEALPLGTYKFQANITSTNLRASKYVLNNDMTISRKLGNTGSGTSETIDFTVTLTGNETYIAFVVISSVNGSVSISSPIVANSTGYTGYSPYENICPITGFTGANIYDDPKYDKTIYWNQLVQIAVGTGNGVTITQDDDGVVSLSGVAQGSKTLQLNNIQHISGHSYLFLFSLLANPNNLTFTIGMSAGNPWISTIHDIKSYDRIYASTYTTHLGLYDITGKDMTGVKLLVEICDLTAMFGAGNEPTVAEFKALFPKDYYAYNTGETSLVSKVNDDPYREVNVTWTEQGTIYGGSLDVITGVLTKTHGFSELNASWGWVKSSSYAGGYYVDVRALLHYKPTTPFICSHAKTAQYVEYYEYGTCFCDNSINFRLMSASSTVQDWKNYITAQANAGTPITMCFELDDANKQTYQLTPTQVKTLVGHNNVWSDCGEVDVTYFARA